MIDPAPEGFVIDQSAWTFTPRFREWVKSVIENVNSVQAQSGELASYSFDPDLGAFTNL